MCKSGRFTHISPVWANKCAKTPVSHIFSAAAVSSRSPREQKKPFSLTKQNRRTTPWRSRTQGNKNGPLRAVAQHMPLRKVGYVASGPVQRRFCYQGLGKHRTYAFPREYAFPVARRPPPEIRFPRVAAIAEKRPWEPLYWTTWQGKWAKTGKTGTRRQFGRIAEMFFRNCGRKRKWHYSLTKQSKRSGPHPCTCGRWEVLCH